MIRSPHMNASRWQCYPFHAYILSNPSNVAELKLFPYGTTTTTNKQNKICPDDYTGHHRGCVYQTWLPGVTCNTSSQATNIVLETPHLSKTQDHLVIIKCPPHGLVPHPQIAHFAPTQNRSQGQWRA